MTFMKNSINMAIDTVIIQIPVNCIFNVNRRPIRYQNQSKLIGAVILQMLPIWKYNKELFSTGFPLFEKSNAESAQ